MLLPSGAGALTPEVAGRFSSTATWRGSRRRSGVSAAWEAHEADPTFLPASDALFQIAPVFGDRPDPSDARGRPRAGPLRVLVERLAPRPAETILAEVMETPTYGSLRRALATSTPNWGGSCDDLVRLCKACADRIPDREGSDPIVAARKRWSHA